MSKIYLFRRNVFTLLICMLPAFASLFAQEAFCLDGLDDDSDGLTDCFDPDCADCDFDCEYRIPAAGIGDITLNVGGAGTDTNYTEVFVLIDSVGEILHMTTDVPATFTNVTAGQYLALALSYATDAGINNLTVGSDINVVSSSCFEMSESYAFQVCVNNQPEIINLETDPLCFCAGETPLTQTASVLSPDNDSLTASIRFSSGFVLGEDQLLYTGTIPVSNFYNPVSGEMTFGPAPPNVIEYAILNTVYKNTMGFGNETSGPRVVSFMLSDGIDDSPIVDRTLAIGSQFACACAEIGAAKTITNVTDAASGTLGNQDVTYQIVFENSGGLDLGKISLVENLAAQFNGAFVAVATSPTIAASTASVNPTLNFSYNGNTNDDIFDGNTGNLKPGEQITIEFTVEIDNSEIATVPLENQATVTGTAIDENGFDITDSPGNPLTATDVTDNGTDPLTDNGEGGTDDPTGFLNPKIGATKALVSKTPHPTLENIYELNFEILVENTGSTVLENITLTDDMSAWSAALVGSPSPIVSVLNISSTTTPTANSANFNGSTNFDLLVATGSGELNPGESFKVELTVFADITQAISGLENSATAAAIPTDGTSSPIAGIPSVEDITDDVTDLPQGNPNGTNPNAPGDTGAGNDPTPITFPANPRFAKAITSAPQLLANRNYFLTYEFEIENIGSAAFCQMDLNDDLNAELGCGFVQVLNVNSLNLTNTSNASTAPTLNSIFDGFINKNLFNSDGCLMPGDALTVSIEIEIDPSCPTVSEPLVNSATLEGEDADSGEKIAIISDDETDLDNDTNYDNESGGLKDPTVISIPRLDAAKEQIASVELPNGNILVTFNYVLTNSGNATISGVALEDDFQGQHGTAFVNATVNSITGTVSNLGGANPSFDGIGTTPSATADGDDILDRTAVLAPGETMTVTVDEEINPGNVPPSGLTNQALLSGNDPNGNDVSDLSDSGSDPTNNTDTPTPLDFGPRPEITKTLAAAPTNISGSIYELTFDFELRNNGTSAMCFIEVTEDLATQLGCGFQSTTGATNLNLTTSGSSISPTVNPFFNGDSQTNLFASNGCIFPGDEFTWTVTIMVDADCATLPAPMMNSVTVTAQDSKGNPVSDTSDDETDLNNDNTPDFETGGTNDPTQIYLPKIGLTKALVGSSPLPNGNVTLDLRFNVENTGNTNLSSLSMTDDLANLGASLVGISSIIVQNINASNPPAANTAGYTGTGIDTDLLVGSAADLLAPGQTFTILMSVEVSPQVFGTLSQPIENQAVANGSPVDNAGDALVGYSPVSDLSDDGTNLTDGGDPRTDNAGAANDNGFGGKDDVTLMSLPSTPRLSKALSTVPTKMANGNYAVTYQFLIENLGGSQFCNINLEDDLASQIGCAFIGVSNLEDPILENNSGSSVAPTKNNSFNGDSNINLLSGNGCLVPGDSLFVSMTIELNTACLTSANPIGNTAEMNAEDASGNQVSDISDDNTDLDNDNTPDNDSGGDDDETLLYLPNIAVTKAITNAEQLSNGFYDLEFRFNVQNTGNTNLTIISLDDLLEFSTATVGAGPQISIENIDATSPPFANNGLYNGASSTELLASSTLDLLEPGQSFAVILKVQIDPNTFLLIPQPIENQAVASARPTDSSNDLLAGYSPVTDNSDDGTTLPNGGDPTTDNAGATNDNGFGSQSDPTIVSLPRINIVKEVANVQPSLNQGNFYVTFDMIVKNSGTTPLENIQVIDDLPTMMGTSFLGVTAGPIITSNGGSPTLPNVGTFPIQIFDGASGVMNPQDEIKISFIAEIDPNAGGAPTELINSAKATATNPNGPDVTDLSDEGTNPDTDNGDGNFSTPTVINLPQISMAKSLVRVEAAASGDAGHFDATYRFYIKNTGNAPLTNLSLIEKLEDQMGAAFVDVIGSASIYAPLTSATSTPLINTGFTGRTTNTDIFLGTATDELASNEILAIDLTVEINPSAAGAILPIENQATVEGEDANGTKVFDDSDSGTNPDTNNGSGGTNDPTPFDCLPANINAMTSTPEVCEGDDVSFTLTGDFGGATFEWVSTTDPSTVLSTDQNPTLLNLTTTATYQVTVFPNNGECFTGLTDQVTIIVTTKPDAPNSPDIEICEGGTLQLTTDPADAYDWSGPNGFTSSDQDPFVSTNATVTDAGTYTLSIREGDCWSTPGTVVVIVNPASADQPTIVSNAPICEGDDLVLRTTSDFDAYQWIGPGGRSVATLSNPLFNTTAGRTTIPFGDVAYLSGEWTVYGIDSSGCNSLEATPITVVINEAPDAPTPTSTAPVCLGTDFDLIAGGNYPADAQFAWYETNPNVGNPTPFSTQENPTVNNISAVGLYTFYLTVSTNDCVSEPGSVAVAVNAAPTITADNNAVDCMNPSIEIRLTSTPTGGQFPYNYAWTGPNGFNSTLQNPTLPGNSASLSGNYIVEVTDENGCSATAETELEVTPKTTQPAIVASNENICKGENLVLETTTIYTGTTVSYNWTGPNGTTTANGDYPNAPQITINAVAQTTAGDYSLVVEVDGCSSFSSEEVEINVHDAPVVVASNDAANCMNPTQVINLSVNLTGGVPSFSYNWSGPNGFNSILQNPTLPNPNVSLSGSYIIEVTDGYGCSATSETVIDLMNDTDQPVVTNNGPHCEGEELIIETTTAFAGTTVDYFWTGPNGTSTANGDYPNAPRIVLSPVEESAEGDYTLIVLVDGCSSAASEPTTAVINKGPEVVLTYQYTLELDCSPSDLSLFADITPGDSPVRHIQWMGPSGFFSTQEDPVITSVTPSNNGSYQLVITDETGCRFISTIEVGGISNTQAQPIITGTPQTCGGGQVILTIPSYSGSSVSYNWNVPGTTSNITGWNSNQLIISPVTIDNAGSFSVEVTVDGCVLESPDYLVQIFSTPEVTATNDAENCMDPTEDIHLTANTLGGVVPIKYQWTGPNGFISIAKEPTLPNANAALSGTYIVTVTDANGCSATAETVVNVSGQPDEPTLTTNASVLCEGSDYVVQATTYSGANVYYEWVGPKGSTTSGAYDDSPTLNIDDVTIDDEGDYTLQVTVDGCQTSISGSVSLEIVPISAAAEVRDTTVCEGAILQLVTTTNADSYEWTGPSGFTSSSRNPFVSSDASAINAGVYELIVKYGNCESAPAQLTVTILPAPAQPSIASNAPICDSTELIFTATPGFDTYLWVNQFVNSANPLLTTTQNTTTIPFGDSAYLAGNWAVIGINADGCQSIISDEIEIIINEIGDAPVITTDAPVCAGEAFTLYPGDHYPADAEFLWYDADPTLGGTPFSTQREPLVSNTNTAGDYNYWLIVSINDCSSNTGTITVTVNDLPTVTADNDGAVCSDPNTAINLTATPSGGNTPYTFAWTGPNGFVSIVQNPVITLSSQDISGNYIVEVTDAAGCTATAQTTISTSAKVDEPEITFNSPICAGERLILNATTYTGTTVRYEWTGPLGSTTSGDYPDAPQIIIDPSSTNDAGDYSIQVTVDGCSSNPSELVAIDVQDAPEVQLSYMYSVNSDCSLNDLTLTTTVLVGNIADLDFAWTGPNGFASSDQNPVIQTVTTAYNGSYTLTVTNGGDCSIIETLEINDIRDAVNQPLISSNGMSCSGGEIKLTGTAYSGSDVEYIWTVPGNGANITGLTTNEITIFPTTVADTGNYILTVIVDNCTVVSDPFNVQIFDAPEVEIAYTYSPNENCAANDLFFTSVVTFGSDTTITYAWSGPNGFTSNEANPEILDADETYNGFYTLTITDANGCSADATIQVSGLRPFLVQPVITGTSQSCEGGEIILTIPSYTGAFIRYFWTTPGPTDNITGLTSNQIIINPLTSDYAGNYEVTVVVDGCVATSLPYEVKIFESPTVTASNDGTQCIPPTKNIALTAKAEDGAAPYTFEWSGPNGFRAVDSVTIIPNVGTNMSGIYVVTVTDANGCTATAETIIDATIQPNMPQLVASAPELCEGETYTITAPIYNGFNVIYNWSGPRGTTGNGDYSNSNILTISNVTKADSGSYSLLVTVDGCPSAVSAEVHLNVVEKLPPSDVVDIDVCENTLLQLTTTMVADEYFWTGPNGFNSNQQEPIVTTDAQIIHQGTYELYVRIGTCFSETAQLNVTVSDFAEQPTLQINNPICEGEDIYLTTSAQCAEYLWIGPDGDSPITMSNPLLTTDTNFTSIPMGDVAYDAGMWYVICITDGGCESEPSEAQEVIINPIPETPTPTAPSTACENAPFQLFAGDNYPADAKFAWYTINPTTPFAIAFSTQKDPIIDDQYVAGFYTFFVTVTLDGCTSEPGSVIMVIDEAPTANPTNNGINCSGLTTDLTLTANPSNGVGPYTFDWEFPNGNTSRAENPVIPFASGDVSGTYTVVVTDVNGCSSLPMATVVRIGDMPLTPIVQSNISQICEGERLTMFVAPYAGDSVTYHWTIPNGDLISTTNASLIIDSVYMAAHHGAYSLQVEVDGCKSAASGLVFVNVFDMPNMPNVPDDMMVCEGTDVTFKTTTAGSGFNYVWSGPKNYISRGIFPAGQNADAILNFSQLNVGEYKLEIETQNCKSDAGSFRIDMENRPATPVLETELAICDGDTLRLETGGMTNGYTYQWIAPGATTGSDFGDPNNPNNPVWTVDSTTIITGTDHPNLYESGEWMVRIVSPNGCNSETSIAVNVDITPTPVAPPVLANGPLCESEDVELTTTVLPGVNYQWYSGNPQNGGVLISNSPNPVLPNQPGGINEYFLMVDMNGCSSDSALMRSVQVEINALPSVDSVSNSGPYCAGDTIELFSPTIGSANYTWSGPMGFNSTQEDPRIFSATAQNGGTYTLSVQNKNCKSEPISMQVLVTPQPVTPIAENNGPGCIGTRLQLSSPSVPTGGFVLYEWTGPNGFVSNLQNPAIDSLTMDDAGEYQLTVSVNGCQSLMSAPTFVEVNTIPPAPVATNNTSITAPICDGETVQLQTQFIPGASYQWVGPNGFTSDLFNPIIEDADDRFAGDYQVIVSVGGCSSVADTTSVFINQAIEVPVAISNGAVCEGDVLTMSVSNPDAAMNYIWFSSPGSVQVGVGPNLTFAPADVDDEGDYYVVANVNGCFSDPADLSASGEDAFVFAQVDVPSRDVAFIGDDLFVCDDTVTLNAKQLFTGVGLWTSGDPDNDITILRPDNNSTLIAHLQSGDNPIVWSVFSGACGITSSDTAIVTLINFPEAVGDLYQIGYGQVLDSTVITNDVPNTSDFVIELITEPRQGFVQLNMDGTFKYVPNAGFIGADFFEYQLCNPNCLDHCVTARAVIEVGVDDECMVPDVFTPNGDGMNETFLIPCLQQYEGSRITIFNRWGDEVFASSNYQNDWDGTYKGEKLPVGTYFYILNMNDPDQTVRNGYIFLQR